MFIVKLAKIIIKLIILSFEFFFSPVQLYFNAIVLSWFRKQIGFQIGEQLCLTIESIVRNKCDYEFAITLQHASPEPETIN